MSLLLASVTCLACFHLENKGSATSATFGKHFARATLQELEIPAHGADEDLCTYTGHVSSYNHQTLTPNWVAYCLTDNKVQGSFKANYPFSQDPKVKGRQASREDYSGSGYDKGHLVPRADMKWDKQAYYETFYFTNVCPQNHQLNTGCWNKLEQKTRRMASRYGIVYVVSGPIYSSKSPKTIGKGGVAVPDAFFKALLVPDGDEYRTVAFVMRNVPEKQDAQACAIAVDSLESLLQRDLFPSLPDKQEARAEATFDWNDWK
ncbi:MAG: DNA/RNA non-specific endonuclease [Bacteroidales bacterium]|nr:DNA/RNA non-specific endonuclease [Bacteroidales bacterium]